MTGKHWEHSEWPRPWPQHAQREIQIRQNILPRPQDWMERGACVGKWPEWDHTIDGESPPERKARKRRAANICRTACPVLAECRAWADSAQTVGEFGVVAGRATRSAPNQFESRWVEVA